MSNKQLVLEAVSQLPEDSTFDRIKEEIDILAAIRRGQEDVAAGRVLCASVVQSSFLSPESTV